MKQRSRTQRFFARIRSNRFVRRGSRHVKHLFRDPEVRSAAKDLAILGASYYGLKKLPSFRGKVMRRVQRREAKAISLKVGAHYRSTLGGYNRGFARWKARR